MKLARMEEDSDGMVFGRSVGKSLEKLDTGQAEWAKVRSTIPRLINAKNPFRCTSSKSSSMLVSSDRMLRSLSTHSRFLFSSFTEACSRFTTTLMTLTLRTTWVLKLPFACSV